MKHQVPKHEREALLVGSDGAPKIHTERTEPSLNRIPVSVLCSAVSVGTELAKIQSVTSGRQLETSPYLGYSACGITLQENVRHNLQLHQRVCIVNQPHGRFANPNANDIIPLPAASLSDVEVALGRFGAIALHAVTRVDRKHRRVLVLGGGVIGLLAARMCATKGFEVTLATRSGTTAVPHAGVHTTTTGRLRREYDVCIDVTGDASAVTNALALLKNNGQYVLLGSPRSATQNFPIGDIQQRSLLVVGSHISRADRMGLSRALTREYLTMVAQGRLKASDLGGSAFHLEDASTAYSDLRERRCRLAHFRHPQFDSLASLAVKQRNTIPEGNVHETEHFESTIKRTHAECGDKQVALSRVFTEHALHEALESAADSTIIALNTQRTPSSITMNLYPHIHRREVALQGKLCE